MNYFITNDPNQELFGLEKTTMEKVVMDLTTASEIAIDCETTGLKPLEDKLTMVQISTAANNYIIDAQTVDITPLNAVTSKDGHLFIGHNIKFDYQFLRANGVQLVNVWCTMNVDILLNNGKAFMRYALDKVVQRYLGEVMSKEDRDSFIGHSGTFTKAQVTYGIRDTRYLLKICKEQIKKITLIYTVRGIALSTLVNLENSFLIPLAEIELTGIYLDTAKWKIIVDKAKKDLIEVEAKLSSLAGQYFPDMTTADLFSHGVPTVKINWASSKQVKALFQRIYPELEGVGKIALKGLDHPLLEAYGRFQKLRKSVTSYGDGYAKNLHPGNMLHPKYKQQVSTGRLSCSKPNIQQLPKSDEYRSCFMPTKTGWKFVGADWNSQELVVAAYLSQEPKWLAVIEAGGDMHSENCKHIFGSEFTEASEYDRREMRGRVKQLSFGLLYGTGYKSLSITMDMSEDGAKELIKRYFAAFPRIHAYLTNVSKMCVTRGYSLTLPPYNRVRIMSEADEDWQQRNQCKNSPIQGSGADQLKQAVIYIYNEIKENGYPMEISILVHDEIILQSHPDYADKALELLVRNMEKAGDVNLAPGLLKASGQISDHWTK